MATLIIIREEVVDERAPAVTILAGPMKMLKRKLQYFVRIAKVLVERIAYDRFPPDTMTIHPGMSLIPGFQ